MRKISCIIAALLPLLAINNLKGQTPKLTLDFNKPGVDVSPRLYGLMTEEINHSYDGGLYAELIRNRIFKDNPHSPDGWSLVQDRGGKGSIDLIGADPLNVPWEQSRNAINDALTTCLKLTVSSGDGRTGVANEGFWGIPVKPNTIYKASFYLKTDTIGGALAVSIESNDGTITYASSQVVSSKKGWTKYAVQLSTNGDVKPTASARFVISTNTAGSYWFNLVSLFPPTYNNRPNGNRIDLMKLMANMKPTFLRFPGGNFLEGDYFGSRFPWKTTLGPLEERPGHPGCWGYRASDGLGLLEFLEWCEDLKIEPLLAVYAGYSLHGDHVEPGPLLEPYVEDALDEIEYITGPVTSKWGAKRAKDGHPAPFKLTDIEIGNEDWFDRSLSYDGRFNQFRKAIHEKYPQLRCISTVEEFHKGKVVSSKPEMIDEHFYRTAWEMEEDAGHYDRYDRLTGPKIFVGEWATREGAPTTNMNAALGDAAWMTGMERNADIVQRSCYAPLFVNVNKGTDRGPRAWQWDSDLIGYNAISSFGSPSYYAQKMFNNYLGNKVIPISGENIPTQTRSPNKKEIAAGVTPKAIPAIFYVATRDTKKNKIFLKVVNASGTLQPLTIILNGTVKVTDKGTLVVLKGNAPEDTNSIDNPQNIVPVVTSISGISKDFTRDFAPYSVNVIELNTY